MQSKTKRPNRTKKTKNKKQKTKNKKQKTKNKKQKTKNKKQKTKNKKKKKKKKKQKKKNKILFQGESLEWQYSTASCWIRILSQVFTKGNQNLEISKKEHIKIQHLF